ncbi:leucine-rich repeat-containing protein 51 [Leptinotarsa decemlineata]|uniref:leucine-rich repeat-containing protein 51 n=1 Tax=Leptinotarsa decemlineata TaxID=7539 RepID=UPI000C25202B|nr:leucine-rich repeat-containing protein 51-like [Leptinotarsa decemlineata]
MVETALLLSTGKPADFSFRRLRTINVSKFMETIGLQGVRFSRMNGVPEKGANKKFLTKSILMNNNELKNFKHIDDLVEAVLEYPSQLGWIDLSFNRITEIDECILKFKSLKILYFHGNCISDLDQVFKLRSLEQLRSVTFHGNPIANHPRYRSYVITVLSQIANLDFMPVVKNEKLHPAPREAVKKLKKKPKTNTSKSNNDGFSSDK